MTGNVIARRYARALFAVGENKGADELSAYGKDLDELAMALQQSPETLKFFKNPLFSPKEKGAVLTKLVEEMSMGQTVKDFCSLLADKGRLPLLPDIAATYTTLLDEAQGVLRGRLVTAIGLSEARQGEIKEKLEAQTGKKLVLDFEDDKDILGGVVLKVGDRILDASIRAQLQILQETIKRGE